MPGAPGAEDQSEGAREAGDHHGQHGQADIERGQDQHAGIEDHPAPPGDIGSRLRPADAGRYRGRRHQAIEGEQQAAADGELQQRQHGRPRRVEIETKRLIDGGLQRRPARSAAERERDGEAGKAEHEDEAGGAGKGRPQGRKLDQAEDLCAAHAELACQAPALPRHGLEPRQQGAGGEGHVEEDMGDQYAAEAVEEAAQRQPGARRQPVQPAALAIEGDDGEDRDDGRHHHGQAEESQQQSAAGKAGPARQSAGDRQSEAHRQQGREQGLDGGEQQHMVQIAVGRDGAEIQRRRAEEHGQRSADDEKQEKGDGERHQWEGGDARGRRLRLTSPSLAHAPSLAHRRQPLVDPGLAVLGHLVGGDHQALARQRRKGRRQDGAGRRGRIHPIGLGNHILEFGREHELQELAGQLGMRRMGRHPRHLDLEIMALGEIVRGILGLLLRDDVIGGRGRVAQHHGRLALEEEAIGLVPALGHREDARAELAPDLGGAIAIDLLDPEQEAQPRCARARILDQDLFRSAAAHEIGQALGRVLQPCRIVDEGEIAEVIGDEILVLPLERQLEGREVQAMGREESRRRGLRGQIGIEPQHDIGLAGGPLQPQPAQQHHAILDADEIDPAGAFGLEGLLDLRPRPPVGDEGIIGIDGQHRQIGRRSRGQRRAGQSETKEKTGEDFIHTHIPPPALPGSGSRVDASVAASLSPIWAPR